MHADEDTFQQIYRDNYTKVLSFLYNLTADWSLSEDLAQETFLRAYKTIESVKSELSLSAWLIKVGYNIFLDFVRKKSSGEVAVDTVKIQNVLTVEDTLTIEVDKRIMSDCVQSKFLLVPENYRAALYLDAQGFNNQDIASILNCTLANVKIRLHRGRKKMKEVLSKDCTFYYDERSVLCCSPKH